MSVIYELHFVYIFVQVTLGSRANSYIYCANSYALCEFIHIARIQIYCAISYIFVFCIYTHAGDFGLAREFGDTGEMTVKNEVSTLWYQTSTHAHTHTYIHTLSHTHTRAPIHAHTHTHTYTQKYISGLSSMETHL